MPKGPKMAEPSSEWGKQVVDKVERLVDKVERLVDKVERLEYEFLKFQTKINTLAAVLGSIGATALALTGYILLSVSGLQTSVAVVKSTMD